MPLIGEVPAVEMTTAELDRRLTEKLGERYLENPDVSVGVKASTRRSVTVDGAVNKAGSYPITDASLLASACRNAMLVIESGKTRTRAARESIERISAAGAHIVGATLTKSVEEASHYGYRLYQYTAVADNPRSNLDRLARRFDADRRDQPRIVGKPAVEIHGEALGRPPDRLLPSPMPAPEG